MCAMTTHDNLASINTVGNTVEFVANDLGYDKITEGYRREEFGNEYGSEFQFLRDGDVVCRVIEISPSGPGLTKVKSYLKRHGSRSGELFSIIVQSTSEEENPLERDIDDEVYFLRIESRMAAESVDIEHDLKFFTVNLADVAPMYLDYFEELTVGSRSYADLVDPVSEVFSIKRVTKRFYSEFSDIFHEDLKPAIHGLEDEEENLNAYAQLVVNRILFLMFVQEKEWLDGNKHYVQEKYQEAKENGLDVYNEFFKPLFFDALNSEGAPDNEFLGQVPYLNGGLFEKQSKEEDVEIDDQFFDVLLNPEEDEYREKKGFLLRYKISLSENNPAEQELVVDPEFIGRIFEMFMQSKDRKDKGAFYTPKDVTQYMSKNALKQYLLETFPDREREISQLVTNHTLMENTTDNELETLKNQLESVRIVDPAVGSGAFIIAMANELVEVSEAINDELGIEKDRFDLKEQFIARNLYGVDIDPSGIELCKFRTWLYLMQDLDIGLDEFLTDNGEYALPNLEFKFFVGNSLAGDFKPTHITEELSTGYQSTLAAKHNNNGDLLTEIAETRQQYVNAHGQEKAQLEKKLKTLTSELDEGVNWNQSDYWMDGVVEEAQTEVELDIQGQFKWSVNIPEVTLSPDSDSGHGGFDIVIGNPPYQGASNFKQDYVGVLSRFYDKTYDFYKTIPRMRHDLYQKFIIRGRELLRDGGVLSYITSKTYLTIGSKESSRRLLQDNRLHQLVIANPDTFDAAVNPAIFTVTKTDMHEENYRYAYIDASETDTSHYRSLVSIQLGTSTEGVASLDLPESLNGYSVPITLYRSTIRRAFFEPTELNIQIHEKYMSQIKKLSEKWKHEIRDSDTLEENIDKIKDEYIDYLLPGDISILGLLTIGGQGLATGSNDDYLAYLDGTRAAEKVKDRNTDFNYVEKNENQFSWMSRVIRKGHIADVRKLDEEDKENGIQNPEQDKTWVPIVKGKGDSYYTPITEYIDWSKEAVNGIQEDGLIRNKRYYFNEGIFISRGGSGEPVIRYAPPAVIDSSGSIFIPTSDLVTARYLNGLLNSRLIQHIIDQFINGTVNTQVQDMRRVPVVIPSEDQREAMNSLVDKAISIRIREAGIEDYSVDFDESIDSSRDIEEVEQDIDDLVEEIYEVSLE